jgi:hypothetical protein
MTPRALCRLSNTSWTNASRYSQVASRLVLTNNTDITLDRYLAGGSSSPRQTRNSATELAYRVSPDLSFGSRASLYRFLSSSGGLLTEGDREDKDEYQFSARSKARPTGFLRTELNAFGGYLNNERPAFLKRGLSGDVNGRVALAWARFSNLDFFGQMNGNSSRATLSDTTGDQADTRDRTRLLRGTLALFPASRVGFNVNASRRKVQTQSPQVLGGRTSIQQILTESDDLTAALQGRFTAERTFNVTGRVGSESRDYNVQTSQSSARDDRSWTVELHELRWGTKLDGNFTQSRTESDYTRRTTTERVGTVTQTVPAGYTEHSENRSLEATLSRSLGRRITLRLRGQVSLTSSRYSPVPQSRAVLVDRDLLRQLFLLETRYNPGKRWSSGLTYQQDLSRNVNLPGSSSGSNFDDHIYRLTWNWSYQLSQRLTANQRNNVSATYRKFTFRPASNRLTMEYSFVTTLEATVGSRLRITTTHSARFQPSGDYVLDPLTGVESFFKSDESQLYSLDARFSYSPTSWLTVNLEPVYQNDRRLGPQADQLGLLRSSNNLRMTGGVAVNRRVGAKGRLSGDLNRSFVADRSTSYTLGLPNPPSRSETDFWQGRLDFTWTY